MARVTISLPAHLKVFVEEEVAGKGYSSCGEYISLLVQLAHLKKHTASRSKDCCEKA
jgi:hypothetical protein